MEVPKTSTSVSRWPEVSPRDTEEILQELLNCCELEGGVYRGQSRDWRSITSTFDRQISPDWTWNVGGVPTTPEGLEASLIRDAANHFARHASAYEIPRFNRVFPLLCVMQHHGCPTRLVDWTESPLVAAYFAARQDPDHDGFVWCLSHRAIPEAYSNADQKTIDSIAEITIDDWVVGTASLPRGVTMLLPSIHLDRTEAQAGAFTIATRLGIDHAEEIARVAKRSHLQRIRIPAKSKRMMMRRLYTLNVRSKHLIPGRDGLGRTYGEVLEFGLPAIPAIDVPIVSEARRPRQPHDGATGHVPGDPS